MTGRRNHDDTCQIIPAPGNLRQDDHHDFKISPDCRLRSCHKNNNRNNREDVKGLGQRLTFFFFPSSKFKEEKKAVCDFNLESFS